MKLGFIGLCTEEFSSVTAEVQITKVIKDYYALGYRDIYFGMTKAEEAVLLRVLMGLYDEDYEFKSRLVITKADVAEFVGTGDPEDVEMWNTINAFASSMHMIMEGNTDIDYYYYKTNRILDLADKYLYCYNHPQFPERLFFSELPFMSGYGNGLDISEVRHSLLGLKRPLSKK